MPGGRETAVCVIAEGASGTGRFESLRDRFESLTVVDVSDGVTTEADRLNPIVDDAAASWILIVRAGERVSGDLAVEIARNTSSEPRAWGYRIAVRRIYCGMTIDLGRRAPGDVRLFHRRKARLQRDGSMKVHGTVVRFSSALDVVLFDSEEAHIEGMKKSGRRRVGFVRRLARFLRVAWSEGVKSLRTPARTYLWIESGFDE